MCQDGGVVGAIGSSGVSPALQQASLLFNDLGWQASSPAGGLPGAQGWTITLDAAGTPQVPSSVPVSSAPGWMTTLDAAGTPQAPSSLQSTLGQNVDLRL